MASRRRLTNPNLAVGYLRVSTDEQRNGIEAQRGQIERWASTAGVTIVAWHTDEGISGGAALDKRPALMAALDSVRAAKAGLLVVAKRDRLARETLFAGMIERLAQKHGSRIVSADGTATDDTPEAAMLRGVQDVFAQYERALIRSRVKAALSVKKSKGERVGSVPYGSRLSADGTHLEPEPEEQAVLARIRSLREAGRPLRAIVTDLETSGARARGARWHLTTVARLVG